MEKRSDSFRILSCISGKIWVYVYQSPFLEEGKSNYLSKDKKDTFVFNLISSEHTTLKVEANLDKFQ